MYYEAILDRNNGLISQLLYVSIFRYDGYDWKDFYKRFKANGGDGFYAEPRLPYYEPALNKGAPYQYKLDGTTPELSDSL